MVETAAPPRPGGPAGARGLHHVPALDGLRGVAILGMLLYHANLAEGSWLSLSTFFTLSGFLITGLVVTERHATDRVDLGSFWGRRARRLVPGALVAISATALLAWAMGWVGPSSRGDFLASTFWVANWRFILNEQSYAELFTDPSPVQHYWSLAVEEQFYLVFPLVVVAAGRWGRRGVAVALGLMAAASVALVLLVDLGFDRAYYGTDVRAAEFAIGGLAALALWRADRPGLLRPRPSHSRGAELVGMAALVAGAALWWGAGPDVWWADRGGLAVYALVVTVPVIAAATLAVGPVSRLLELAPLVWLGTVSYGLYLYHWPLFLLLTPERTGLDDWPLFALRLAVTSAVAVASYHLLEQPVRRRRVLEDRRRARTAWLGGATLSVVIILAVTVEPPPPEVDFAGAREEVTALTASTTTLPAPEPIPDLALFGDSTAVTASVGVVQRALREGEARYVEGSSELGCGLAWGGRRRSGPDEGDYPEACPRWDREWAQAVDVARPDVALVMVGSWDAYDRVLPGGDDWVHAGDPEFDRWYRDHLLGAIDMFAAADVHVVWATIPPSLAPDGGDPVAVRGQAGEPARIERLNELIREAARLRPDDVTVLEWAEWLESTGADARLRPDGVHLTKETSSEAGDWLVPETVAAWREARS